MNKTLSKEAQQKLNRLYYDVFGEDHEIIEDLKRHFETASLVRTKDGVIDAYATHVACGAYEVMSYIKQRIKLGEEGK